MRLLALAVMSLAGAAAGGNLDRIDAEGVTERGGGPKYARMLPRTGTNGLLSATLLPPLADWASVPIANLYYASASAPSEGNGAPQYPFKTLGHALEQMAADSALIMAPGTYSGSGSVPAGHYRTLLGSGRGTYVTSLTISTTGTSPDTVLELAGLKVGTLTVNGGRMTIRMAGAYVERLEGSATPVTVVRLDMGARVNWSSLAYEDVYSGYSTSPMALALSERGGNRLLGLSGGRGVVVDGGYTNVLAFMSDLAGATGAVYAAMSDLRASNDVVMAEVSAEKAARSAADTALSNNLSAVIGDLRADFGSLGGTWGSQAAMLMANMTRLRSDMSDLDARVATTNARQSADIAQLRSDYTSAQANLSQTLHRTVTNQVAALSNAVPGIVDARAGAVVASGIAGATNSIVASAVAQADANALARESVITGDVGAVQQQLSTLGPTVTRHDSAISAIAYTNSQLRSGVTSLQSDMAYESSRITTLNTAANGLTLSVVRLNTWTNSAETSLNTLRGRINAIIDSLIAITNKANLSGVSIPAKF